MKKVQSYRLLALLLVLCTLFGAALPVYAESVPAILSDANSKPVVIDMPAATAETAHHAEANTDSDTTDSDATDIEKPISLQNTPDAFTEAESNVSADNDSMLADIASVMYAGLPEAPTGYYIDSNGLPVVTGNTKISIEGWGNEDYSDYQDSSIQVALDDALLSADNTTAAFPRIEGEDYAIVPISMQVLYPANNSSADITLPDDVELLGYGFTSGNLCVATEEERQKQLHYDFSEIAASVAGIYVKTTHDFQVTLTYTDTEKTLGKTLNITLDDSAPVPSILQDRFSQESQVATYAAGDSNIASQAILQVTQCINTAIGWMNYLGGQPALCGDHNKWAWGPGATYKNSHPPVANYTPAGQVWVLAEYFGKGWLPDQSTLWSRGFNNGSPVTASAVSTYSQGAASNTGSTDYYARLLWQAENYPDSLAADVVENLNQAEVYLGPGETQTVYIGTLYTPSNPAWQRFVILDYTLVTLGADSEIPGMNTEGTPVEIPWQASYERTAILDLTYTVKVDKSANITHEKLNDAVFTLRPSQTSGNVSGGTWTIENPEKVVTTVDGEASATWTVHYEVTKSASQSGSITANSEQDALTNGQEQANQQQAAAQGACESQVNGEIEAALAAVKQQLSQIKINYTETTVPHGFDATDSSSGFISVPSDSSATVVVANQPWQAHVTWEKRDALTGGRITEDAEYAIYEWSTAANDYEISKNYRVTRLANGLYTVTVSNPTYTDWQEGYVYYTQKNLGKYRIEEITAPAGYKDAALQGGTYVEHWSQDFEITASDQTYSYTGDNADANRPKGNQLIIKKIEAHTGEIINDDAVFTLYQWNQERGLYEKSKDYTIVRNSDGLYTVTTLHKDWTTYEDGYLYYEDTLCDVREDTQNSDGTTTTHPQYYKDYEPTSFSLDVRASTNDGQFVVVESKSPYGYYGDWSSSRELPNFEVEDAGKRAYYIRLTDDGSTITLADSQYNAQILAEDVGGTRIDLGNKTVSLQILSSARSEYASDNLFRNNPWYSTVVWEKRDALTGGLVDASAEFEIQEWDPQTREYKKSTHYQVVRRSDGKYTVNLIGDAFFAGWEGKQGVLYYHQANEGKYRIVELQAPASYTLKAWQNGNWTTVWSEEIVVHPNNPQYVYTGEHAARNMPLKTQVLIKKVDTDTGALIKNDTVFTLYEWNERNNQYEVSTNYKIVRRADGLYTVTTLHSDWTHYEEGYLYYEDTQTEYADSGRWFSNEGKFLIVESKAPAGYYGDFWRNDEPGTHSIEDGSDLGKRGYAFTITQDNGTLWLTNADYNCKILYDLDDQKGNATVILASGRPTSAIINNQYQPAYNRTETGFGNKAKYGYVVFDRSQYNKKWAKTGDDEEFYITHDEVTTDTMESDIPAPKDTIKENRKKFQLVSYDFNLISGPVDCQVTLDNVHSLADVPTTKEYTLPNGKTVLLSLVSATWLEEPRSSYTGYVDLGYAPSQPTAAQVETITADDGYTFTGQLVSVDQSGDYKWVNTEVPATYYGWSDVQGIFLGSLVLPHNDDAPVYQGYETDTGM